MTGNLTLARGLAVLCLLVLVGVCVSPFFYGWHVVAAWVFLAAVLGVLAAVEDRSAQAHRRRMRAASRCLDEWFPVEDKRYPLAIPENPPWRHA